MKHSAKAAIRMAAVRICDFVRRVPFARPAGDSLLLPYTFTLSQPFRPSETLENKKHNLRAAAERINRLLIRPGQVFSFWAAVGNPNDRKRFREGRNIHAGKLTLDMGGGLCQASGIIYHMVLLARLEVLQRFNHSVDLYTDETRFAPLGTDATVCYGFKDLRFYNNLDVDLRMVLTVETDCVTLTLMSDGPVSMRQLRTDVNLLPDGSKEVVLTDADTADVVSSSIYKPC